MPLIEWLDAFETGISSVDHEHRQMIALLNEMADAVQPDAGPERVAALLGEVYAKIQAHFALEERTMREGRYSGLAAHKADHERLLDVLRELMESHEADPSYEYREALSLRLRDWFMIHFHEHDAKLRSVSS